MIKMVALIRRNPALTPEAFRAYWQDVHVPLIKERLPGLVKYTGSFPIDMGEAADGINPAEVDAIVELGFPDRATMEENLNGAPFQAADRLESSARLMDLNRTQAVVMEEVVVPTRQV